MKERPILFSAPMVRALLDGSKTQTRRVMRPQPEPTPADYSGTAGHWWPCKAVESMVHVEEELQNKSGHWGGFAADCCPHGGVGDRLWVRETWRGVVEISPPGSPIEHGVARYVPDQPYCRRVEYSATQERDGEPWRPSIHMPRWASRLLLEITGVRVERLQDISEADAIAEGATHIRSQAWDREHFPAWRYLFDEAVSMGTKPPIGPSPKQAYEALWEDINGAGSWDANPFVWVVEFRRVQP
jgi:hypothetical protein